MKRTLLTGFGPFGPVADNPSQRLAEHFGRSGAPGHSLMVHVFPVSFCRVAQQLTSLLGESGDVDFDIVLMLGVNTGEWDWRIERLGTNADQPESVDMDGEISNGGPIIPDEPQELECTLPVWRLVAALKNAGVPAVASNSAGGYLCNHVLFRSLSRLRTSPGTIAGFVHIPADPATLTPESNPGNLVFPSFETHVLAIETILRELA
jgi:pyroglutamyl-peptidase